MSIHTPESSGGTVIGRKVQGLVSIQERLVKAAADSGLAVADTLVPLVQQLPHWQLRESALVQEHIDDATLSDRLEESLGVPLFRGVSNLKVLLEELIVGPTAVVATVECSPGVLEEYRELRRVMDLPPTEGPGFRQIPLAVYEAGDTAKLTLTAQELTPSNAPIQSYTLGRLAVHVRADDPEFNPQELLARPQ